MGNAINGKKLFMKMCISCHTTEKGEKHKIGPNLYGIMGKTCGSMCFIINIPMFYRQYLD